MPRRFAAMRVTTLTSAPRASSVPVCVSGVTASRSAASSSGVPIAEEIVEAGAGEQVSNDPELSARPHMSS